MKYFKVTCSNGFCGCDEEFYIVAKDEKEAEDMGINLLYDSYAFAVPDNRFLDYFDYVESQDEAVNQYEEGLDYWVEEISPEEYLENAGEWDI